MKWAPINIEFAPDENNPADQHIDAAPSKKLKPVNALGTINFAFSIEVI
jgi:hypothetical protein